MRATLLGGLGLAAVALFACKGGGASNGGGGSASSATTTTAGGAGGAGGGGAPTGSPYTPAPLPALGPVALATEATIAPVHGVEGTSTDDPRDVARMSEMLAAGWGDTKPGPGEAVIDATLDGSPAPTPAAAPVLLARFVHLTDTQLADDESPARLASFDAPGTTSGAFRPQEGFECRILNAAVRTINRLHTQTPLDFVVLGGDNADNAQDNELGWFLSILDGAPKVECDSGRDDDPTPGPDNDGKDPFVAPGLAVPWKWVTGNHDILRQGTVTVSSAGDIAVGSLASTGTRDWSQPGGPVVTGDVVADPRRKMMTRADMLKKVHAAGDGHGVSDAVVSYGKAFYTFDAPQGAVRFLVVDTGAETGSADGMMHQADVDGFVKPALDQAKADGKLVVVVSHHRSSSLTDGSAFGGTKQADALTPQQWRDLLGSYDNVVMHLGGHTHVHRVTAAQATNGRRFWELETSALADFPNQMRFIEIWDQGDKISVRAVPLDYATDGDAVAAEGRRRGVVDLVSSWTNDGSGAPSQRAVQLWLPKPSP
jgi:hypothetical protein